MHPFQRINHFPGMMEICRKAALARNLKRMQARCPVQYSFHPTTWDREHPAEMDAFRRHRRANPGAGARQDVACHVILHTSGHDE